MTFTPHLKPTTDEDCCDLCGSRSLDSYWAAVIGVGVVCRMCEFDLREDNEDEEDWS